MLKAPISGYAPVNGLQLYYEIQGEGEPLILLHGGVGSTEMFRPVTPSLSEWRQVIAVDLQAHGRTADIARPLRFEAMADDIAMLMKHLGIARAELIGYSLGGGVALRLAIQHPALVKKLVVIGFACKRMGWYSEIRAAMVQRDPQKVERMKQSAIYEAYVRLAPRPEEWPALLEKLSELLGHEYDWSNEVARIPVPVLLVFGDADSVSPAHGAEFFELLGGGKKDGGWDGAGMIRARLAILPATTHYNVLAAPTLPAIVKDFLSS